ncbi:hypothetical protein CRG98_010566 [Punica granatum]|uniref:Uncharacterized protein n=1 Tax=Punica granatum TaxID=22663 RepID=A0A2I0KKR1_PUNGR|nr:hypothetical protein CRG98_010566 [Punica granatum]
MGKINDLEEAESFRLTMESLKVEQGDMKRRLNELPSTLDNGHDIEALNNAVYLLEDEEEREMNMLRILILHGKDDWISIDLYEAWKSLFIMKK